MMGSFLGKKIPNTKQHSVYGFSVQVSGVSSKDQKLGCSKAEKPENVRFQRIDAFELSSLAACQLPSKIRTATGRALKLDANLYQSTLSLTNINPGRQ
jgi:hypothetical protein